MEVETCQNCKRIIGNLEVRHLFHGQIVCAECDSNLRAAKTKSSTQAITVNISDKKGINAFGVAALVLGIIASLSCWIPIIGCLAIPVALLGILFGFIGVLSSFLGGRSGVGFPIAGSVVCIVAAIIAFATLKITGEAIEVVGDSLVKGLETVDYEIKESPLVSKGDAEKEAVLEEKRLYAQQIEIYDFTAKYFEGYGGQTPGVKFKIRNNGNKTLKTIKVLVYFKDSQGGIIAENSFYPVLTTSFRPEFSKPLKPNYIWQMPQDKFLPVESVPDEWQEGSVAFEIDDFEFEG